MLALLNLKGMFQIQPYPSSKRSLSLLYKIISENKNDKTYNYELLAISLIETFKTYDVVSKLVDSAMLFLPHRSFFLLQN